MSMCIKISNNQIETYPYSITQLRRDNPTVSFPASPTEQVLASWGVYLVAVTPRPDYHQINQSIDEGTPQQVDGRWQQTWVVRPATSQERQQRIEAIVSVIKEERDRRTREGGYLAGGKWFHSDLISRSQQIGLALRGANIPEDLQWKTMDGSFVTMTPELAGQILVAAGDQDFALFAHAESLILLVIALDDPTTVDVFADWPLTFEDRF